MLIIAEKPSVARKIASFLSNNFKVLSKFPPLIYFRLNNEKVYVTSALGHLFTLSDLRKDLHYPSFDYKWVPAYIEDKIYAKKKFIEILKKFKNENKIIIATDYDIEGELIGYNILRFIFNRNNAYRMVFSAITKKDILSAFYNLKEVNLSFALAGETRHIVDWIYGINLSRALTKAIRHYIKKVILSIGRVQGPTLKLVYEREKEIENFKPEPYYLLFFQTKVKFIYPNIIKDYKQALELKNKCSNYLKIEKIIKKKVILNPPYPYNLSDLQQDAWKLYRISPKKTLDIAQKLYEKGYCLVPETLVLTENGIKRIKEVKNEKVFCLNNDLKIDLRSAKLLRREINEEIIKLVLADGTEMFLTKDHPVLVYKEGLRYIKAEELKEGDYIALLINKNYELKEEKIDLVDVILEKMNDDRDYIYLSSKIMDIIKKFKDEILKEFKIEEVTFYKYIRNCKVPVKIVRYLIEKGYLKKEEIKKNFRGYTYYNSRKILNIELNEDFWYVFGYIVGDGHLTESKIIINSRDVNKIKNVFEKIGIKAKIKEGRLIVYNKPLVRLFNVLGCPSRYKARTFRIPTEYLIKNKKYLTAFLAGYFDADGCVQIRKGKQGIIPRIIFTSVNREAIYTLKILLQLLGIGSFINKDPKAYNLIIYAKDCKKFYHLVKDFIRVKEKIREVENYNENKKYSHSYMLLFVDNLGEKIIVKVKALKNQLRSNPKALDLKKAEKIKDIFIEDLRKILEGDLYFVKIRSIEKMRYKGIVYDLYVEDYHNFIANGIVVHNCSYPRTESQKLPFTINFREIFENLSKISLYKEYIKVVLKKEKLIPNNGPKDDVHPAIHPTGEIPKNLSRKEFLIYDLIVRRFIATFLDPSYYYYIKVLAKSNDVPFIYEYKFKDRLLENEWIRVYWKIYSKEFESVLFREGEILRGYPKIEKRYTEPPPRYSPASLVKKLEELELGTKATRPQVVHILYKRKYIKGRKAIKITTLGRVVVEILEQYIPEIFSVELTRKLEKNLHLIEKGRIYLKEKTIEEAKEIVLQVCSEIKEKEKEIGYRLYQSLKLKRS